MLIKLDKNIDVVKDENFEFTLSDEIKEKIKKYWNEFIEGKDYYWDGEIANVCKIDIDNGQIKINKAYFSNLIYSRSHDDITIKPLYTAIFLKTIDGKYVIRKDKHSRLGLIGGLADLCDFDGNKFIPEECLKREVKEETGIDLYNTEQISNFKCKYIDINDRLKSYNPIGFIYVGNLNYTSEEFIKYMKNAKTDGEIIQLIFCTAEECLNLKKQDDELTFLEEFIYSEMN